MISKVAEKGNIGEISVFTLGDIHKIIIIIIIVWIS